MRVTITPASRPQWAFSLIDGSWLNTWPLRGEVIGLERDGLVGWDEGVEPRYEAPEIPGQDGNYAPDMVTLAARVVTIRGFYAGNASTSASQFKDRLAALVGEWLTLTVEDSAGVRSAEGFVSAIPVNERISDQRLKFTLVILCPDPLKYGPPATYPVTGTVVTVDNAGTAGAFPLVEVTTPVTHLDLQAGGRRVRWVGSAPNLTLDFRDAFPLSGGVEVGTLVFADLFRIPPGGAQIEVDSDGDVTVKVASAWK